MVTISPSTAGSPVTLVNVFTVEADRQQPLVELLVAATAETMRHLPGFVSASIHRSLDGTRVTNYAQWRNPADFEAMLADPRAQAHMAAAGAMARFDPHLYEVVSSHEAA
jgi:quinol monooxygenase YgiN